MTIKELSVWFNQCSNDLKVASRRNRLVSDIEAGATCPDNLLTDSICHVEVLRSYIHEHRTWGLLTPYRSSSPSVSLWFQIHQGFNLPRKPVVLSVYCCITRVNDQQTRLNDFGGMSSALRFKPQVYWIPTISFSTRHTYCSGVGKVHCIMKPMTAKPFTASSFSWYSMVQLQRTARPTVLNPTGNQFSVLSKNYL